MDTKNKIKALEDRIINLRVRYKKSCDKLNKYKRELATADKGRAVVLNNSIKQLEATIANTVQKGRQAVDELNYYVKTRPKLLEELNELSSELKDIMDGNTLIYREDQEVTINNLVSRITELEEQLARL